MSEDNHEHQNTIEKEKQYFITEENFQRLQKIQGEIYQKTEVSASVRKLVNSLITEENLTQVKDKMIEKYR